MAAGSVLVRPSFARAQRLVAIDQAAQGERDARMHGRGRRRGTLIDALGELAGGDPRFGQAQRREVAKNIAPILAADAMPQKEPEAAYNRHPDRRWCEAPGAVCIDSHYDLEGKLPMGITLANKLREGNKKIADFIEFQSELALLSPAEIDQAGLRKLTGIDAPIANVLEQSIFQVNQVMQFGKFLAVTQPHPADANRTVVTAFVVLAVEAGSPGARSLTDVQGTLP